MITISEADLTARAKEAIRLNFNPSNIDRVSRIKMLTAALLSELDRTVDEAVDAANADQTIGNDVRGRLLFGHAERARDQVVIASMCCVLAVTTGAPPR